MPNFAIKTNLVIQAEIIVSFYHILCELRLILLPVKTAKKRGGPRASFFVITLGIPLLHPKGQRSNQN